MEFRAPAAGFLSSEVDDIREAIIEANSENFLLARDANLVLMKILNTCLNTVQASSMSENALSVRMLLRAAGSYQGALLLLERGMHVEARNLARSLVEVWLCISANIEAPDDFLRALTDDFYKSTRNRLTTAFEHAPELSEQQKEQVSKKLSLIDKALQNVSPKKMAKLGGNEYIYLVYQELSNNAGHVTAASLDHYIEHYEERSYWHYKIGAGTPSEVKSTLYIILFGITNIMMDVATHFELEEYSDDLGNLVERFSSFTHAYPQESE